MTNRAIARFLVVFLILATAGLAQQPDDTTMASADLFARRNLVAWCIVPFDGKQRGPRERAEMVQRLGFTKVAYDWRTEHVPQFEQEILEYKRLGLEYFAFWSVHDEAFKLFEKHGLHPQIWQTAPSPPGPSQDLRVQAAVNQLLPLVERAGKLGCQVGLYNHGGWGGEPENLVAICKQLREAHRASHVGVVYNLHHAHNHLDDFAPTLTKLKPYLLCLNLNGMARDGEQLGRKILPLGEGEFDVKLLSQIRDSGFRGPIGIIGHTQDDVEERLRDNLDGLDWILPQLDGKPAGPKPKLRTWSPQQALPKPTTVRGTVLDGRADFRRPPLTIECRATLTSRLGYNILVASDTKDSGEHWELFSMTGSGTLTAYLPGMKPDHVRSQAMVCDNQPHTLAMIYEANRVRLFVDGKQVADQSIERLGRGAVPGGLAIGQLVEGGFGCSGSIDWVHISRGVRPIREQSVEKIQADAETLLLWPVSETKTIQPRGSHHGGHAHAHPATPDLKPDPADLPKAPEYSSKLVEALIAHARSQGDAHRGLMVFSSAKSACLACHKLGKHGGTVGPELSTIARLRKPEEIVEGVLWPKRQVKPEYVAHAVVDSQGRTHQGYIVRRDDRQFVLRDPTKNAGELTLLVDEIDETRELGTLMPDNLAALLTPQQLGDLLRLLLELGAGDANLHAGEIDSLLTHLHAHLQGPATFTYNRDPLNPPDWPSWQHPVNRDRLYDFYAKQADHFRQQPAPLLPEFPGLDGGQLGHWGNQNDTTWASNRWNETQLGSLQCGVFRGAGVTVPRGVCVRLGETGELSACFNPDTLTYDALWSGGFVKFSSVRHGFMHGLLLDGTPKPRPVGDKPTADFKYHGFYRHGNRILFAYRIGDTEFLDAPWSASGKFVRIVAPVDQHPLRSLLTDAPAQWPLRFATAIEHGVGSPYAVDTIGLPFDNPWKALLFCGGHAFDADGSALICTMAGDVWRVTGFQHPAKTAQWRRFAAGLHHALGIVADRDGVFVLGRDQITRLHDLNLDGEADFYECYSNAYQTSPAGHDFICGLERDPNGNFYTASGNQGLLRISADGQRAEVIATGFRNPDGLGLLSDGTITVPCSEGEWTPASLICAVRPPATSSPPHFGYPGPKDGRVPELPLVYLPRGLDNSSGGQTWVNSSNWGPLTGQSLHFSFGSGSSFLLLRDQITRPSQVDGPANTTALQVTPSSQGAIVPLPGEFRSGVHRGRFHPTDGQLYVTGMQGWGCYTAGDGCFQRVRYTGEQVQLPTAFRVHENGVAITFSLPLERSVATQATSHFAQCWNYRYGPGYGSPEFSARHPGMRGHDSLTIAAAHLLADGRTLFLEIPELQPVNQLHLRLQPEPNLFRDLFITVHALAEPFADLPGYRVVRKTIPPHPILADLAMATRSVPNPHRAKIARARSVTIETASNLSFATRSIVVRAGEPIALTLVNPDVVPHNWALVKPGTLERVGELANQLISDPDAALRHYIPQTTDVLAYTTVVLPQDRETIYFRAPEQSGRYPFLCTFPGHWKVMNGELVVEPAR